MSRVYLSSSPYWPGKQTPNRKNSKSKSKPSRPKKESERHAKKSPYKLKLLKRHTKSIRSVIDGEYISSYPPAQLHGPSTAYMGLQLVLALQNIFGGQLFVVTSTAPKVVAIGSTKVKDQPNALRVLLKCNNYFTDGMGVYTPEQMTAKLQGQHFSGIEIKLVTNLKKWNLPWKINKPLIKKLTELFKISVLHEEIKRRVAKNITKIHPNFRVIGLDD